jgi:site-specific recombinase XerC
LAGGNKKDKIRNQYYSELIVILNQFKQYINRLIMEREDLYREYLRNQSVSKDSIKSYVHYINRVSEITDFPINFNTLFDVSCINTIIDKQKETGINLGSIANYKSALRMYVDMVKQIQTDK